MMARIGYCCPFVPIELITACGHTPCRPQPMPARRDEIEGLCAWANAFSAAVRQADAAVFTTGCDQMRRMYEKHTLQSDKPAFLLNIPKTGSPTAHTILCDEFERLERFLVELDGGRTDPALLTDPMNHSASQTVESQDKGLAVIGGPLFECDFFDLSQLTAARGLPIVFNGTESAWQNLRTPFEPTAGNSPPLAALADYYLRTPAIWRRPAEPFFDRLTEAIHRRRVLGAMVIRHPFCDYWKAAIFDLRKRLTVPLICIETDSCARLSAASLSRLEAFLEQWEQ